MPQLPLPVFPAGTTLLSEHLAFECHEGQVTDFNGHLTVFTGAQADVAAFGLRTRQVVVNSSSSQGDSRRGFGVRKVVVQWAVDNDRARGAVAVWQCQGVESQGHPPDLLASLVGVQRAAPRHSAQSVG